MKTRLLASLGLGALVFVASQAATAGVSIGLNLGVPGPVYVAPAPIYAPAPVYAPPSPPVVAYQAVPVVAPGFVIGWHGERYWDGRRWWGRREWYGHHRW